MFNYILAAIVGTSSLVAAAPALARQPANEGHYEWRSTIQPGPRSPLTALNRVWVAAAMTPNTMSACDCKKTEVLGDTTLPCMKKRSS